MRAPSGRGAQRHAAILCVSVVFGVALLLRMGHLAGLRASWEDTHLFSVARGDAAHHWQEALEIVGGDVWLKDRVFWKGPGYSYFLAGLIQLFGRSPGALRWPLAVLGALNCAGLVLLARRALGWRWSAVAGVLAATNGVLIAFDGELFFPTLLIALNLPALWLLSAPEAGPAAHVVAGGLLGLAALVHPVYLVPAGALALWSWRRRGPRGLALALAVGAVVAPVTLSNVFSRGQPLLISWNGGINVYVGNHPCFDQYSGNRTSAWARIMRTPVDAGIEPEYRRDALYYRLARREALRAPLGTLATLLQKSWILFSPVEYASNIRLYELREHSPVLRATLGRWGPLWLPFGLWAPFAILGIVGMLRHPNALGGALGVWSLGLASTIVLSFNTSRYRAPLVFFGCVWAAQALAAGWRLARSGRSRPLVLGAVSCLVLGSILSLGAVPQRGYPLPLEWDESLALASQGALDEAEGWVERALERAPADAQLELAAADFFRRRGRVERERALLRSVIGLDDPEPDLLSIAHHRLAKSWAAAGRIEYARREIGAALAVDVDDTVWRGHPYYQLGLGPLNACWLRLEAAGFELDAGDRERASAAMDRVRNECPLAGRLKTRLVELEAQRVLATPRATSP